MVDDEPHMLDLVRTTLEAAGFTTVGAASGQEGLRKLRDELPEAVVLDVNLPDMSGYDVLENLRMASSIPVIMLTVQDSESDRVHGLELGADDYLGKPFGHRELVSRVKALLRRTQSGAEPKGDKVRIDDRVTVDLDKRVVEVDGTPMHLRPTEFKLLHQMLNHPGRLLTHETLLSRVWGPEYRDDTQLLRLYVNYLRKKLEPDPAHPRYILNERGLGYRFVDYHASQQG